MRPLRPFTALVLLSLSPLSSAAQTSPASTPPPQFPQAAPFDARTAPESARQHAQMIRIPGGSYPIGSPDNHPLANRAAMPMHRVAIAPFRIDRTEVTNAQFAEFLNALPVKPRGTEPGGNVGPRNIPPEAHRLFLEFSSRPSPYTIVDLDDEEALIGVIDGRFAPNPGFENHPATETTWAGALAYCRWRGARLPTEVEWEAAARGPQGRTFPWGEAQPTTELAVINRKSGDTVPVGSRPRGATPEGLLDMAGSMLEWTSTLDRPYPYRADDGREDPALGGERVVRGGNYVFDDAPERLTTWNRTFAWRNPATGHRQIGLRCAAGV
ncbi:MAG: formylglycine-generating enzyme family protein [Alphaproteobacteria bacterium]|nr:formylglycine-generating enzyme family protein [Alphaproteobacteria bacterium]